MSSFRIPIWLIVIVGLVAAVVFWGFIGWAVIEVLDIARDAVNE